MRWHGTVPEAFVLFDAGLGLTGIAASLGALLALGMQGRSAQRHEGIHGTAHWASKAEIKATGLLPRRGKPAGGVYVGGWRDARGRLCYLRHTGPEHIAAIAPTRSGKGVSLVIPTLLSWQDSAVILDLKEELWNITAGWREDGAGNRVMRFNPAAAEGSVAYNPLEEIRLGTPREYGDAMNVATMLVDPNGKGLVDHWQKTSHALLTGVILHVLYKARADGQSGTLTDVAFALSDPHRPIDGLYRDMKLNKWGPDGGVHAIIASAAKQQAERPPEERGSVLSTAMSFMSLYRDPLIARNTSRSDFRMMDLMNSDKPVTLYLVVRAEDKDRMTPLIRLVINQILRVLLRPEIKKGQMPHKHRLLLMLDEFPSLGNLEVFEESLAYIAGHGIKAFLIMQDITQLRGAYGQEESILSNCHIRVAFAPNRYETAKWLSDEVGTTTVVKEDITVSGSRHAAVLGHVSKTFHQVARPLITPDEVMRLKSPAKDEGGAITEPGDMLIFLAGHAPILGTQSLYFRDPTFTTRADMPTPAGDKGLPAAQTSKRREFRLDDDPNPGEEAAA
jgi:type IV secretion system protein VirD4